MTNKIKRGLIRLWKDESGQGATEYILILVVVSAIVFAFKEPIKAGIIDLTGKSTKAVGDDIGRLR